MKTYLVGGAVRDALLYLPIKDRDWVVVGATPKTMLEKGFQQIGRDFPVFLHPNTHEEYALARTEYKSSKGHNGFITQSSPNVTLEQDLKRRDLTINAIAVAENGELFDPYGGKNDLKNRILRHVSTAFTEDPLRILRVARFAAQFAHLNFRIAEETQWLLIKMTASGELEDITVERVWKETEKALLTRNPQVYFQVLHDCNALKILFPELNNLYKLPAPIEWHSEINVLVYALINLTIATTLSNEIDVRFATFFHNLGYTPALLEKYTNNYHFSTTVNLIEKLCQRLHVPRYISELTLIATKFYHIIRFIEQQPAHVLVSLFDHMDAWRKPYRVEQIALISEVDARTRALGRITLYPQGNYIRKAFKLTQSVSIKDIINNGFKGKEIRKELTRRRVLAINK